MLLRFLALFLANSLPDHVLLLTAAAAVAVEKTKAKETLITIDSTATFQWRLELRTTRKHFVTQIGDDEWTAKATSASSKHKKLKLI